MSNHIARARTALTTAVTRSCDARDATDADGRAARRAPHTADAPDGHDLIPDDFVATWDEEADREITTVAEALRVAERAPSTTPDTERRRCPDCLSVKIMPRPDSTPAYACGECSATFATPLPAPTDARTRAAHAPETGSLPACPDCEGEPLYPVPSGVSVAARWLCGDCGGRFERAGSRQATLGEVGER